MVEAAVAYEENLESDLESGHLPPVVFSRLESMVSSCEREEVAIREVASTMRRYQESSATLQWFSRAVRQKNLSGYIPEEVVHLDKHEELAVAMLHASYWERAIEKTNLLDLMPTKNRDEWQTQIREGNTPPFTRENVRETLQDLGSKQMDFLTDKVDGVFFGLSKEHVTNRPEGFRKRMIVNRVFDDHSFVPMWASDLFHDFRSTVELLRGLEPTDRIRSHEILKLARRTPGEWFPVDGGAFRIKTFLKGTLHLEIHPDLAKRLNLILAKKYPGALYDSREWNEKRSIRMQPIKSAGWKPMHVPVAGYLIDVIRKAIDMRRIEKEGPVYTLRFGKNGNERGKHFWRELSHLLESFGASVSNMRPVLEAHFSYNPTDTLSRVVATGTIPDEKAMQFYPTPIDIGRRMVGALLLHEAPDTYSLLEPSAGQGALLEALAESFSKDDALPMPSVLEAIEIVPDYRHILSAKMDDPDSGLYNLFDLMICPGDFEAEDTPYDRILMNPPFADGRALDHFLRALGLLNCGGVLVALLPKGLQGRVEALDHEPEWSANVLETIPFPGTSIETIMVQVISRHD